MVRSSHLFTSSLAVQSFHFQLNNRPRKFLAHQHLHCDKASLPAWENKSRSLESRAWHSSPLYKNCSLVKGGRMQRCTSVACLQWWQIRQVWHSCCARGRQQHGVPSDCSMSGNIPSKRVSLSHYQLGKCKSLQSGFHTCWIKTSMPHVCCWPNAHFHQWRREGEVFLSPILTVDDSWMKSYDSEL